MREEERFDGVEGANQDRQERIDADPKQEGTRRDFIKKAGKVGIAAGFAHFLLVGGRIRKAMAATDLCETGEEPWSTTDVCDLEEPEDSCVLRPKPGGAQAHEADSCWTYTKDECKVYTNSTTGKKEETGDLCSGNAASDWGDECDTGNDAGVPYETYDYCPKSGEMPEDKCTYLDDVQWLESGDECESGLNALRGGPDVCVLNLDSTPFETLDVCPPEHGSDDDYDQCVPNVEWSADTPNP